MNQPQSLVRDYMNFEDQTAGLSGAEQIRKELTFCGAAAVSLLCNEQEEGAVIADNLRESDRFGFIREHDIISSIWSLAPISQSAGVKSTPPVLAWSSRLQVIFLGFCCTNDMKDVRSDLNVRTTAPEDIGSRFHSGFLKRSQDFVVLVKELMKTHKVVFCGHSFGGALATTSAYLAMEQMASRDPVPNSWMEGEQGVSIITFGSPACSVAEPRQSTTSLRMDLSSNFHHVFNPDDYVPFALNDTSRRFRHGFNTLGTPLRTISPTLDMLWPVFEFSLNLLAQTTGEFCHFGCLYSVVTDAPGIRNCRQVLQADDVPAIPDPVQVERYHRMSHYFHCVKNSVAARLPLEIPLEGHDGTVTSEAVPSMLLPMPGTVSDCSCVVHSDRLAISIDTDTRMIQYLLKGMTFKMDTAQVELSILGFPMRMHNEGQASIELSYQIDDGNASEDIGKAAVAVQQGITLHDIFGRSTEIEVNSVQSMSLDRASLPQTLESIRLVMLRALVAQMSKVQALRSEVTSNDAHSPEQISEIDENIKPVVSCIDCLVANASPHLFVARLNHAFEIIERLWPQDFKIGSDSSELHVYVSGELSDDLAKEKDTSLLRDIPAGCPQRLRDLLKEMLLEQNKPAITLAALSVKDWEAVKRPTLREQFVNVPTFSQALQKFSRDLYDRSTDDKERNKQAITQFQDLMGNIQLCHLVIITQLDAPYEWYCRSTEGHQVTSATISMLPSYFSGTSFWSRALASPLLEAIGLGAFSAAAVGVTGGLAVLFASTLLINHLLNNHKEYLDLKFSGALATTLQALDLPAAKSNDIVEKTILECVGQDIESFSTSDTLEKWKKKLEDGLRDYPGAKANQWYITPTYFWAQWLFKVAQIAQLRIQLSGKICIGVQGSTEAGKSQMLTVLTGASENYFKPGSNSLCRTLGIQSYDSDELSAIFLDSPGFDDQEKKIKYMAGVFQELFAVVIIMIPMERTRSESTEEALRVAANLLRDREDTRPLRILLSKADHFQHHRKNQEVFRNNLRDVKAQFMDILKRELGDNFTTFRQQPFRDGIICRSETLEDIVKPFSTHAQMSLDGVRALGMCPPGTESNFESPSLFRNLCELAETGEIWDIESLRSWLQGLSPNSVPTSNGRVRTHCAWNS